MDRAGLTGWGKAGLAVSFARLGDHEVADLARQHFRDYAEVILRFDTLVPAAVVRYLQEEGFPATDVVSQVNQTVKEAWEQVTEGPAVDTVTARQP